MIEAGSVVEACDVLERTSVSLIILDWFLGQRFPGLHDSGLGSEVLKKCRGSETSSHVPVLVITSFADVANVQADAYMNGADALMRKPLELEAVQKWLCLWKARILSPFRLLRGTPTLDDIDRRYVQYVFEKQGGHISQTAEVLGINRSTVSSKLGEIASGSIIKPKED
jgi:DNA-binding NtrC family response regulator